MLVAIGLLHKGSTDQILVDHSRVQLINSLESPREGRLSNAVERSTIINSDV